MLFSLRVVADTARVSTEGYDLFEDEDVIEEFEGFFYGEAVDVMGDFAAVFVVDAEVGSAGFGGAGCRIWFDAVSGHFWVLVIRSLVCSKAL